MDSYNPKGLFWWQAELHTDSPEKSNVHEALFTHVRAVEEDQYLIHRHNFMNAMLYANRELQGLDWGSQSERQVDYRPISNTAENLITQVVDTVSSLIGKNKPKPTPVLKDADFSVELMARQLDRYLYGEFQSQNIYEKGQQVFTDSLWAAIGALKIDLEYDEDGKAVDIYTERVMPDEIIVDQREAMDGKPMQIHHRKLVNKDVLMALYPDRAHEIRDAKSSTARYTSYRTPTAENTVVIESWKLAYGNSAGRHCIVMDGVTLVDEEYTREVFPFVFFRWFEIPTGFYGRPLVEEIAPFQLRHNELNYKIRLAQDLMCVPRIFVDAGAKLSTELLDNNIAKVIRVRGSEPKPVTWPAIPPELYAERERNKAGAFEQAGVSQLSAQAKLPDNARLDSSKALREFNLIENQRFARQAQRYERFYMEVANHLIELSAILHKGGNNRRVKFHNRNLVDMIDWEDVARLVDNDQYVLQIEASSILNQTPAAREDIVFNWMANGIITPERARSMLGHPDLEEEVSLQSAAVDDIKATMEQLDKGELVIPTPEQDLQQGKVLVHLTLLRRRRQLNVPPEVINAYQNWLVNAEGILADIEQKAREAQAAAVQNAQMQMGMQDPNAMPQAPGAVPNVGPDGQIQPGIATTTQGVPVAGLTN